MPGCPRARRTLAALCIVAMLARSAAGLSPPKTLRGARLGGGQPPVATVILFRHGEKDKSSGDDLSERGRARAQALASHFAYLSDSASEGLLTMYAFVDHPSRRPLQTLEPTADSLLVTIDTSFGRDDVSALADALRALPPSATALVCWEHAVLSEIASALGFPGMEYGGSEYDVEWTIAGGTISTSHEGC
jgi:hypothetical protein